jgi:hypothetical protein
MELPSDSAQKFSPSQAGQISARTHAEGGELAQDEDDENQDMGNISPVPVNADPELDYQDRMSDNPDADGGQEGQEGLDLDPASAEPDEMMMNDGAMQMEFRMGDMNANLSLEDNLEESFDKNELSVKLADMEKHLEMVCVCVCARARVCVCIPAPKDVRAWRST